MKVIGKNLLVKEIVQDVKTKSGLILGDGNDIKFHKGAVVNIGEDISKDLLQEGDIVWFDRHRTYPIVYEGVEYLVFDYYNVIIIE
jgi:co-chaperonin GroES (HSP10)